MANDYDGSIKIDTEIDTSGAQKGLNDLTSKLTKFAKGGAGVLAVTKAFKATTKAIKETTQAYQVQLKAEKQLETAAKNNPYLDKSSVSQLKEYASYLQSISTVGDEELIPLMAQLASAGRTQAEIQSIMSAALDVSASGAMSMESAVKNLNKTFSGLSGELGESIPQIKALTSEELKSGKAVEVIAKSYKGMAEETAKATGSSKQLANAWGDFKENIGKGWTRVTKPVEDFLTRTLSKVNTIVSNSSSLKESNKAVEQGNATSNQVKQVLEDRQDVLNKLLEEQNKNLSDNEAKLKEWADFWGTTIENAPPLPPDFVGSFVDTTDAITELTAEIDKLNTQYNELVKKEEEEKNKKIKEEENDKRIAQLKEEVKTRDELRAQYDATVSQAQREIEQRRALGEVITEQQEAQELLDIATQAYITMMSDPAFIGNNGTYEHEVNARKQIAEYAKTAAVDIKEIKQDTLEAANALIESFNNNSMADTIQETIDALQLEAKQFNENSTVYEFYVQKIQQLSELKKKVIQDEQKENLNTMLTNVKDYINQFADITDSIADLALENSTKNAEAETKQLDKSYTDGLISYEEYCNKKSDISKKQAQEEYKVKMWEWSASLLQATANIAQGVSSALSLTPPMSFIQAALVSAAGAVQLATLTSSKPQRPTFQTGGIVGGASYTGDHIDARVNSGEMILNAAQQANLWKMANNGNGSGSVVNMPVTIESRNGSNIQTQLDKNGLRIIVDDMVNTSLQLGRYSKSLNINNSKDSGVRYL